MHTNPQILDNSEEHFQLKAFLDKHLCSGAYTQLSVASGYWDLPAMVELLPAFRKFLGERIDTEIRFLIGEEPKIRLGQLDNSFPERYIKDDLRELPFKEVFKEAVSFLSENLDNGRIKVKLYKKSFLHAKCYIIGAEREKAVGIIGSSNFTRNGLLGNTELNDIEYDHRIVNYIPQAQEHDPSHRSWFEKLWNDPESIDWNRKFVVDVLGLSKFGNLSYSPYEIYIRILYEIYGEDIEIEEKLKTEEVFERKNTLTTFQQESVRKALNRLNDKKVGMCLIGDSVGLGKSYIARDIIERIGYYERKNVVIVCPASLREDWQKHLKDITVNAPVFSITEFGMDESFERVRQNLLYNKKSSGRNTAIDLLVIDESHNLKTQGSKSFMNLLAVLTDPNICNELPKVLMLSATPVNNGIKDLANQILLAKGGNEKFFAHFGIESLLTLFGQTQKEFKRIDNEDVFAELYPILNKIMVKRTKHQVKKDFPDALLNGKPIIFPEEKLINELYELDNKEVRKAISDTLRSLETINPALYDAFTLELTDKEEEQEEIQGVIEFFQTFETKKRKRINQTEFESVFHFIDRAIKNLKLIPYSYLSEKLEPNEQEAVQANARKNLTGVMKVSLFKSFDSSIHTFQKRIDKYETYLSNFETLFFENKIIVRPEIIQKAINRIEEEPDEDVFDLILEELASFEARENRKAENDRNYKAQKGFSEISLEQFNTDNIRNFIKQDRDVIAIIKTVLGSIKTDTKLEKLKSLLKELQGQKVLIFSYFATTVDYLKEKLDENFLAQISLTKEEIAFLKSKNGKEKSNYVQRFAPVAQRQEVIEGKVNGKIPLQILCSTDVLSEGQNLQDCGIIINYDLHWNPVKMIQRNGRINRLGSSFSEVKIHNFRPEAQLDKFLKLLIKLQQKIRIIGGSVGIDSSILGEQITDRQFGLMDSIYSEDKDRQRQAIEELERENELAFDEQFENDLREFMRKATDEQKENLRQMNFNKWCGIPSLKDLEKLLVFNIGKGEFEFIRTDGNRVAKEPNQLKALRLIRSFDEERKAEKLSFQEKEELIKTASKVFESEKAYQSTIEDSDLSEFMGVKTSTGGSGLKNAKQELLTILHENQDRYSADNIKRLQNLLTSKNLALENRLRSYLKRYDNQVSLDFLDSLAILSVNLVKDGATEKKPDPEMWFGYYAG